MLGGLSEWFKKSREELFMAGVAAAVVLVVYVVFNLIVWNNVILSYAFIFALVTFIIYFLARRLMKYVMTRKEGVIKEHK
jgi:hypothetical protein